MSIEVKRAPAGQRRPMFDRYRGDRLSLAFSYDAEGHVAVALEDIRSRTVGRLELVPGGTAPFDSWRAETCGRRWPLGSYDIWIAPNRRFRLRCSYVRDGALRNETGNRVATIGLGGRAGYVETYPAAKSEPSFALLLLLTVRVALFEQASRVALPSAGGGGYA